MQIDVNGTRIWFDVDGPVLVPDGPTMRERPTLVLVHGGPGGYDHTYFKPHFERLTDVAQLVYVDLRDHGRSGRHDPTDWTFETCADDLRVLLDALGIARPTVLGHSMGGFIVEIYGVRHPGHAGGLILSGSMARFDLDRLTEGFRQAGGDDVAEIARRSYAGEDVTDHEWARAFAAFGPNVPSADELARRTRNPDVHPPGMDRMRALDVVGQLGRITCPSLVVVGELDAVTPLEASKEIHDALPPDLRRLEVVDGAGHFPWLDDPERYLGVVAEFVASVAGGFSGPAARRG